MKLAFFVSMPGRFTAATPDEMPRFAQGRLVSQRCNWASKAQEWENFLTPAVAWKRGR
jgi:hypothetical protein